MSSTLTEPQSRENVLARLLPLKTMQSLSLHRSRTHNEILSEEKGNWELTDHKCAGGRRAGQGCVRPPREISQPHHNIFPFWPRVNTLWPSFCPFPLKSHSGSQVTAYTVVKIRSRWSWNVCNALFLLAGKKNREDSSTHSSMRVLKTCAFIKWGQIWWIYCHR